MSQIITASPPRIQVLRSDEDGFPVLVKLCMEWMQEIVQTVAISSNGTMKICRRIESPDTTFGTMRVEWEPCPPGFNQIIVEDDAGKKSIHPSKLYREFQLEDITA